MLKNKIFTQVNGLYSFLLFEGTWSFPFREWGQSLTCRSVAHFHQTYLSLWFPVNLHNLSWLEFSSTVVCCCSPFAIPLHSPTNRSPGMNPHSFNCSSVSPLPMGRMEAHCLVRVLESWGLWKMSIPEAHCLFLCFKVLLI